MQGGFLGVIHLPPLPGDPNPVLSFDAALSHALQDAHALAEGGAHGAIVENFGSAPFVKGTAGDRLPPHQVAFLARAATRIRVEFPQLHLGINCLRNDALASVGIAAACGASLVRVNVHTGACLTDQGIIEGEAAHTLRYRRLLNADAIQILADVQVKHAAPLAPRPLTSEVEDTLKRGRADGVIVTGTATGAPISVEVLREVAAASGGKPVWLGSGVTPQSLASLAPYAQGVIVGTWLKRGGKVEAPVDPVRVRELSERWRELQAR